MIWAYLMHLSFNMWEEEDARIPPGVAPHVRRVLNLRRARPFLRFDERLWNALKGRLASGGANMVVIDLGDGIRYESHPEIAVRIERVP